MSDGPKHVHVPEHVGAARYDLAHGVNDTLGPVIRDTDGRVFSLSNLDEMLTVSPFPELVPP